MPGKRSERSPSLDTTGPRSSEPDQTGPQPDIGDNYHAQPAGSLGLLALGAVGLNAWRAAREAANKNRDD